MTRVGEKGAIVEVLIVASTATAATLFYDQKRNLLTMRSEIRFVLLGISDFHARQWLGTISFHMKSTEY
jgi:hypothetical protein